MPFYPKGGGGVGGGLEYKLIGNYSRAYPSADRRNIGGRNRFAGYFFTMDDPAVLPQPANEDEMWAARWGSDGLLVHFRGIDLTGLPTDRSGHHDGMYIPDTNTIVFLSPSNNYVYMSVDADNKLMLGWWANRGGSVGDIHLFRMKGAKFPGVV